MTFTVAKLRNPERELPRAVALALGLTTALYVLISIGVFGTLTVDEAIGYGEIADRRGRATDARRRRLHAYGDRGADRDGRCDERDALRRAAGLTASLAEIGCFHLCSAPARGSAGMAA